MPSKRKTKGLWRWKAPHPDKGIARVQPMSDAETLSEMRKVSYEDLKRAFELELAASQKRPKLQRKTRPLKRR